MSNGFFGFMKNNDKDIKDISDKTLVVKTHRCPQNHPCPSIRVCPVGAMTQQGYKAPTIDMSKCIKCGKCIKYCPMRALALE